MISGMQNRLFPGQARRCSTAQALIAVQLALSRAAANGYMLFKDYSCVACHQGVNLGGNLMQYFGAFHSSDLNENSQTDNQAGNAVTMYTVPVSAQPGVPMTATKQAPR